LEFTMAIRPILETLGIIRKGALMNDLSEGLAKVTEAVRNTGRPGKLVLTLAVKPSGKGSVVRMVTLEDEVTVKLPPANKESSVFWMTPDGGLSRSDPDQYELGLRPVPSGGTPPPSRDASVDTSTGEISQQGGEVRRLSE